MTTLNKSPEGNAAIVHSDDATTGLGAVAFWIFVVVSAPFFALFSYNSGYGYDQLEYLVMGRSLTAGYRFFDFMPSKGFAIYLFVAGLISMGVDMNHASLSIVIAGIYAAIVVATYLIVRIHFGKSIGMATAILVALCAVFMELNFLQPTGFVYLFGLLAFHCILKAFKYRRLLNLFMAGLAFSIGFHFKSVALFYGMATFIFLIWSARRDGGWTQILLIWLPMIGAGFIIGIGIPLAYFAMTNRLQPFWEWTIDFPLFHYPPNTLYLSKLYTKLLWFHVFLVAALGGALLTPAVRRSVFSNDAILFSLLMGIFSYGALFKTQSSHYFFPGAAFFSIFIAAVFHQIVSRMPPLWRKGRLQIAAFFGLVLIVLGGILYRPAAAKRLMTFRDFEVEEAPLRNYIQSGLPPDDRGIFIHAAMKLYWISNRYPGVPFLDFYVQTTYYLQHHPEDLLNALDDPKLTLIEFRPENPGVDEPFYDAAANRELLEQFHARLEAKFQRDPQGPEGFTFWRRKTSPAEAARQ